MSQSATPVPMPQEIPAGFFEDLPAPPPQLTAPRGNIPSSLGEMRTLALYDAIIDDILANPGSVNIRATAQRLQKGQNTLRLVMRSDMFKARWAQRRDLHNELVQQSIVQKMTVALGISLDVTKEKLEKSRDSIPLPILDSVNKTLLDRLGFNPEARQGGASGVSVTVNTQNNNNPSAQGGSAAANAQASPDGLSRAQAFLRLLEGRNAASGAAPGNAQQEAMPASSGAVVEGEAHRVEP